MNKRHQSWLDNYMEACQLLNKSEHTLRNYRSDLEKFLLWYETSHKNYLNFANSKTIGEYKTFLSHGGVILQRHGLIKKWIFYFFKFLIPKSHTHQRPLFIQRPLAVASRRRHLSAIKNFFEFLKQTHEDNGKIFKTNPVKSKIHAIKLKEMDVTPTKLLDRADWEKLEEKTYRIKDRLMINLLYFGGLRLQELCDLRWEHFDEASNSLTFIRKGGRVHTLFIQKSDEIFKLLALHQGHRTHNSAYLFTNSKGKVLTSRSLYNQILRLLIKSDCEPGLSPHSFRKACATELYIRTKDLLLVRNYLNHRDAKVTQTYIDNRALQTWSNNLEGVQNSTHLEEGHA